MKVILAGGAGFVGRNLIRVMINEGFEPEDITVIDKNCVERSNSRRTRLILSLRKRYSLIIPGGRNLILI